MTRHRWINKSDTVTLTWQCTLAGVSRASVYARQKPKLVTEDDEMLKRLIDEEYTRHPFYGSRKMVVYLARCGHTVNRKRAQRLRTCSRSPNEQNKKSQMDKLQAGIEVSLAVFP